MSNGEHSKSIAVLEAIVTRLESAVESLEGHVSTMSQELAEVKTSSKVWSGIIATILSGLVGLAFIVLR